MDININISNYEEFLLSAVDGELNEAEMVALEAFLEEHPHIREELVLLESLRLTPDPVISFENKAALYRQSMPLSATNYESQLLDYVDNELHGPEKQALELLIKQHPHIREELNILKRTRLQPDLSLRFENKAILYKNNDRTKVRPIWWWSAAAAVVAGLGVFLLVQSPTEKGGQVAVNQPASSVPQQHSNVATSGNSAAQQQNGAANVSANDVAAASGNPAAQQQSSNANDVAVTKNATNTASAGTNSVMQPQNGVAKNGVAVTNSSANVSAQKKQQLLAGNTIVPTANAKDQQPSATDNNSNALTKIAQPVPTSEEVVKQLQDKLNDQQTAVVKAPVMANAVQSNNAVQNNKVSEAVAAAAPVQGELVVSVTMNGDSKLLNGVANVARFFSKKKK